MGIMTWIYTDYPPPSHHHGSRGHSDRSQSPERRWDARGALRYALESHRQPERRPLVALRHHEEAWTCLRRPSLVPPGNGSHQQQV